MDCFFQGHLHGTKMYRTGHIIRQTERKRKGKSQEYIHCPIDDFKAFMYTFMYGLLLRKPSSHTRSDQERSWIKRLFESGYKGGRDHRSFLREQVIHNIGARSANNPFAVDHLFAEWFSITRRLRNAWTVLERCMQMSDESRLKFWHLFAYKGVADLLQAYVEHIEDCSQGTVVG